MYFYEFLKLVNLGIVRDYNSPEEPYFLDEKQKNTMMSSKPFVFFDKDNDWLNFLSSLTPEMEGYDISTMPFDTCFFEIQESWFQETSPSSDPTSDSFKAMRSAIERGRIAPSFEKLYLETKEHLVGLYVNRGSTPPFDGFDACILVRTHGIYNLYSITGSNGSIQNTVHAILYWCLSRINTWEPGSVSDRTNIKLKVNREKSHHRIGNVIYLSKKKHKAMFSETCGKTINWTHRWWVRGHKVNIPGRIGHDMSGNITAGYTYRKPHIKGPQTAPLINKIRVVKEH